jgi:hypothetical protein
MAWLIQKNPLKIFSDSFDMEVSINIEYCNETDYWLDLEYDFEEWCSQIFQLCEDDEIFFL